MVFGVAWGVESAECCSFSFEFLAIGDVCFAIAWVVFVDGWFWGESEDVFYAADVVGVPVGQYHGF